MDHLSKLVELTKGSSLSDYDSRIYVSAENANRTIYLADLPRNTSYMDLSEYYESRVGSCQIAIKRPLFKNFYFAFIQFQKLEHAQQALKEHRFPIIKGQVCRALAYNLHSSFVGTVPQASSKKDPTASQDAKRQVFIKNCPKDWTHVDLHEQFKICGEINSAKVSINANFESRGYGFVEFATIEAAAKAVSEMNGKEFEQSESCAPSGAKSSGSEEDGAQKQKGSKVAIEVCHYESKRQRLQGSQDQTCSCNLYVKNFPKPHGNDSDGAEDNATEKDFNDSDLVDLFKPFGEILSVCVMKDDQGKSKGFGFVSFVNWQDSKKALEHFRKANEDLQGGIVVCEAKSKEERQQEIAKKTYQWKKSMMYMNLIVKNVEPSTTEQEMQDFFTQFGNVSNVKLLADCSMAFVSFTDRESARAAKQAASEILFKGRHLFVAFVEPRETRRLHFEEKIDKKAYEKHQMHVMGSKNADLIQLISSLGLLMNQLQVGNQPQRRMNTMPMGQRQGGNFGGAMGMNGQPLNGVVGHQMHGNRQRTNAYGHQQQRRMQGQRHGLNQSAQNSGQPADPQQMPYGGGSAASYMHQQMAMQASQHQQQFQQVAPSGGAMAADKGSASYQQEVYAMFNSQDFAQATAESRKEIIGTAIYKHVTAMVGDQHAPKVTGMIIDLDPVELNMSIQNFADLQNKVNSAMQLLVSNNLVTVGGPSDTADAKGQAQP